MLWSKGRHADGIALVCTTWARILHEPAVFNLIVARWLMIVVSVCLSVCRWLWGCTRISVLSDCGFGDSLVELRGENHHKKFPSKVVILQSDDNIKLILYMFNVHALPTQHMQTESTFNVVLDQWWVITFPQTCRSIQSHRDLLSDLTTDIPIY